MTERKLDANGFPAVETRPEAKCDNPRCTDGRVHHACLVSKSVGVFDCPDCNGTGRRTDRSPGSRRMG